VRGLPGLPGLLRPERAPEPEPERARAPELELEQTELPRGQQRRDAMAARGPKVQEALPSAPTQAVEPLQERERVPLEAVPSQERVLVRRAVVPSQERVPVRRAVVPSRPRAAAPSLRVVPAEREPRAVVPWGLLPEAEHWGRGEPDGQPVPVAASSQVEPDQPEAEAQKGLHEVVPLEEAREPVREPREPVRVLAHVLLR
jgi:hypothetical protein